MKTIDMSTGVPLVGVQIMLYTYSYSLRATTNETGEAAFAIPVGGTEVGRWPEAGVSVQYTATRAGYRPATDRFMLDRSVGLVIRMRRM